MREARAAKAAERAAAKEAAEKNGETEEKVKKATKKATTKKSTAKKKMCIRDRYHTAASLKEGIYRADADFYGA